MRQVTLSPLRGCISLGTLTFLDLTTAGTLLIPDVFAFDELNLEDCALAVVDVGESVGASNWQPLVDPLVVRVVRGRYVQETLQVTTVHLVLLHHLLRQLRLVKGRRGLV